MPDLPSLIARISSATAPDRALDEAVALALGWKHEAVAEGSDPTRIAKMWVPPEGRPRRACPEFTGCIHAVLTTIPPDLNWLLAKGRTRPDEPLYGAQILDGETVVSEAENDASPALALLAASLKARLA